jgi:hypothetical protein
MDLRSVAITAALVALLLPCRQAAAEGTRDANAYARETVEIAGAIGATGDHVRGLLRRARRERSRAVACLDEALSRVDVASRHAREEAALAREAARLRDVDDAREHYVRALRLRTASREAAAAGDVCAAMREEATPADQGTWVRLIVDPKIAPVSP